MRSEGGWDPWGAWQRGGAIWAGASRRCGKRAPRTGQRPSSPSAGPTAVHRHRAPDTRTPSARLCVPHTPSARARRLGVSPRRASVSGSDAPEGHRAKSRVSVLLYRVSAFSVSQSLCPRRPSPLPSHAASEAPRRRPSSEAEPVSLLHCAAPSGHRGASRHRASASSPPRGPGCDLGSDTPQVQRS